MSGTPSGRVALFVPGGPGAVPVVERRWFAGSLPVRWADPPRFEAGAVGAFSATLDFFERELEAMAAAQGGPVPVVAWSFGARCALEVASRRPELVASLRLLGPTACIRDAFVNLARRLGAPGGPLEKVRDLAEVVARDAGAFWTLADAILATPDLLARYWSPGAAAAAARWDAIAAEEGPVIDAGTFRAVVDDVLGRPPPPPGCFHGPATVLLGSHDPLLRLDEAAAWWRERLPASDVRVVPCGHMVQFELPASTWLEA